MVIYTDGGCTPNPGVGRYAWVVLQDDRLVYSYRSHVYLHTTNNRMELLGVISACLFSIVYRWKETTIYCDSKYTVEGYNVWSLKWRGVPKLNGDLWSILLDIKNRYTINLKWVRGHSCTLGNNLAHKLCSLD